MSNLINVTIDGVKTQVPAGTSVLEAARSVHINIPTLCYLKDINAIGACRMCLVDVGGRALQASCVLPVTEGMVVKTNTPAVREARKNVLKLILSNHDRSCLSCIRSGNCELQQLSREMGVEDAGEFDGVKNQYTIDDLSPSIVRDNNKCILCRRCVAVCDKIQHVGVIGATDRGFKTQIASPWGMKLAETACINCGQCIAACPVGALHEKDAVKDVWASIQDPAKHVLVQTAPAVRAALGEEFGMPVGTSVTGKMAAVLRRLGFDKVFDTDFAADLTIMEEATELLGRLKNGGKLPMITSCSPGWIKYCETFYPDFLENLSTCKSPHEMMGALLKSVYAKRNGIDPASIVVVSIMPCTAKKFEAGRPELSGNGLADVDYVLTTRELAQMIKEARIDFAQLEDADFDTFWGESTGAGVIFGATGGVMEAALRTAYEVVTGKTLEKVEFCDVRGYKGIKEATVDLDGMKLNVAVAHSTGHAKKLLDSIRAGEKDYAFIEIMGCPGGCVMGGGQPHETAEMRAAGDTFEKRAGALYGEDERKVRRKSHENPAVQQLYKEELGAPNSEKAHHLLHTHYTKREKYSK